MRIKSLLLLGGLLLSTSSQAQERTKSTSPEKAKAQAKDSAKPGQKTRKKRAAGSPKDHLKSQPKKAAEKGPRKKSQTKKSATINRSQVAVMNARFQAAKPKVGQLLPDISAFDAQGKEFKLGATRGKHTVLIFGCLT